MIRNPIIHKEVLTALRTRKAVVMQVLFLLATAALVWLLWPDGGLQDIGSRQARRILGILAVGELILVALFAPAFTAASLTGEREHNTFESLYATALKPWEITVGKMVGSLGFIFLLVISGIPALSLPLLLGGVTGAEVLAAVGILLLTAVYLGMIGMLISTMMHRSYRAIIVTYAVLLVICFVVAAPAWPVSKNLIIRGGAFWQGFFHILASLSPLEAMFSLVWPDSRYSIGAQGMPAFWILFIPLSCGITVITSLMCLYKLHRPIAPPRPREKLKVIERGGKITRRSFMFLFDPRKRKKMIGWWQNPILSKEFRTRPMLQGQWLLRTTSICAISSVLLMFLVRMSLVAFMMESPHIFTMMSSAIGALIVVVLMVIGPAMAGGSICADRETGVWDLIRTTALPSWRIVSGKFQAAIIPALLMALAMAPALLLLLYFKLDMWLNLLHVLAVVGMTIMFVATTGVFFSSIFSRTPTATAWTYSVVMTMGLGSLLVLLAQDIFSQRFIRTVFLVNPVAAAMDAGGHAGMRKLNLFADHLKIMSIATAILFVVTVARVFQLRGRDA